MDTELELIDIDGAIDESFPAQNEETTEENEEEGGEESKEKKEGEEKKGSSEEGEENEEEEGEEETEGKKKPDAKKEKPNRAQKRIDTLTRRNYELQRRLEEIERQSEQAAEELPPQPNPSEFKTQREYDFAMGKWQAEVAAAEKIKETSKTAKINGEISQWNAKITRDMSKYEDLADSYEEFKQLPLTPALHEAMYHEKDAAHLVRFLGKNLDVAERILRLSPTQQAMKFGEICTKMRAAENRKTNVVSNAPKPGKKLSGGGGASKKDPSKMSAEEWAVFRGYKTAKKG
jgi:hypothetical protein